MNNKITITIKDDDEGFLGSEDPGEIDVEKSYDVYCKEIRQSVITSIYPTCEIRFEYGSYSGKSINVEMEDWFEYGYKDGGKKLEDASDLVQETIGNIYSNGSFWVYKKENENV